MRELLISLRPMANDNQIAVPEQDAVRYYLTEACERLGFVSVDAVEWLANYVDKYNIDAPRFARTMGTPMDAEERKRLKLGNLKMTKEAWAALTEAGRVEPAKGIELTIRRATTAMTRDREQLELMNNKDVDLVQFWCADPCLAMQAFMAPIETLPKEKMPRFPLNHCNKAVCECRVSRHYRSDVHLFDYSLHGQPVNDEVKVPAKPSSKSHSGVLRNFLTFLGVAALLYWFFGI